MRKKTDPASDRESCRSSSQCYDSNCSCCTCSSCLESDASSPPPSPPPKRSKVVSQKKDVRPSAKQSSSSHSTPVQRPKPKFDLQSYLNSSNNSQPTKGNETKKVPSPSKTEKGSKDQTSVQKKNEVVEPSKPNSSQSSSKKSIMPELRALDNKSVKTKRKTAEIERETDGSELESDFYIEKPAMKKTKKSSKEQKNVPSNDKKEKGETNKKKKQVEGKERFSREEDEEIISFIDKNVDMPQLLKHMNNAFPLHKRNSSSFYGRRESLFKRWKKSLL